MTAFYKNLRDAVWLTVTVPIAILLIALIGVLLIAAGFITLIAVIALNAIVESWE